MGKQTYCSWCGRKISAYPEEITADEDIARREEEYNPWIICRQCRQLSYVPDPETSICPNCHRDIPLSRLWANNLVCACGYHFRMKARQRIKMIADKADAVAGESFLVLLGDYVVPNRDICDKMLEVSSAHGGASVIAVMPVPMEEAKRFGIMITDENGKITDFEEKPANPRSNLASMGIYIFNWKTLKEALIARSSQPNLDFGKHVIPYCHENGAPMYAYEFNGYWKDVGTLNSYWEANMELIDIVPEFNLYEEYWKIYTKSEILPPQYIAPEGVIERSIVGEGSEIAGQIYNSVIGCGVVVGKGTVIRDSIVMNNTVVGEGCELNKAIVAENVSIGDGVKLGIGEEAENDIAPHIYNSGIATVGEKSVIPKGVSIGKNTVVFGVTESADYPDGILPGGKSIIKAGEEK